MTTVTNKYQHAFTISTHLEHRKHLKRLKQRRRYEKSPKTASPEFGADVILSIGAITMSASCVSRNPNWYLYSVIFLLFTNDGKREYTCFSWTFETMGKIETEYLQLRNLVRRAWMFDLVSQGLRTSRIISYQGIIGACNEVQAWLEQQHTSRN